MQTVKFVLLLLLSPVVIFLLFSCHGMSEGKKKRKLRWSILGTWELRAPVFEWGLPGGGIITSSSSFAAAATSNSVLSPKVCYLCSNGKLTTLQKLTSPLYRRKYFEVVQKRKRCISRIRSSGALSARLGQILVPAGSIICSSRGQQFLQTFSIYPKTHKNPERNKNEK